MTRPVRLRRNSTGYAVREWLDKNGIAYTIQMGGDGHYQFWITCADGVERRIKASYHKGEHRAVTNAIADLRRFVRTHGVAA